MIMMIIMGHEYKRRTLWKGSTRGEEGKERKLRGEENQSTLHSYMKTAE
jgi:hypothetical protein